MIYCEKCGFSLVEFELEEMCEVDTIAICWECKIKENNN